MYLYNCWKEFNKYFVFQIELEALLGEKLFLSIRRVDAAQSWTSFQLELQI